MGFGPEGIGVGGRHGNGLTFYHGGISPARSGVERYIDTRFLSHLLQQLHVQGTHLGTSGLVSLITYANHGLAGIIAGSSMILRFTRITNGPRCR